MGQLATQATFVAAGGAAVSAATEYSGTGVSMSGYRNVTFQILLGAVTVGGDETLTLQSAQDGSTWIDCGAGTVSITDSDSVVLLEVENPIFAEGASNPSLRVQMTRANGSAVVLGAIAVLRHKASYLGPLNAVGVSVEPDTLNPPNDFFFILPFFLFFFFLFSLFFFFLIFFFLFFFPNIN